MSDRDDDQDLQDLALDIDPSKIVRAPDVFIRGQTLEFYMDLPPTIPAQWFDDANMNVNPKIITPTASLRLVDQAGDEGAIGDLGASWSDSTRTRVHFYVPDTATATWPIGPVEFVVKFQRTTGTGTSDDPIVVRTYYSHKVRFRIVDTVNSASGSSSGQPSGGGSGGSGASAPWTWATFNNTDSVGWVTVGGIAGEDLSSFGSLKLSISGFGDAGTTLNVQIYDATGNAVIATANLSSTVPAGGTSAPFTFPSGARTYLIQIQRIGGANGSTVTLLNGSLA